MRSTVAFCIAFAILTLAAIASAQPPPAAQPNLRIFDRFGLTLPPQWQEGPTTRTSVELYVARSKDRPTGLGKDEKNDKPSFVFATDAGMLITVEIRRDHAEALRRLAEIASEQRERVRTTVIDGWPAIERRYRALMPRPGEADERAGSVITWFSTTAVAAGTSLVRFETTLAPDVDPKVLDEALAIGRSLKVPGGSSESATRELDEIVRQIRVPPAPPESQTPTPGGQLPNAKPGGGAEPGVAVRVQSGIGELEVASSNDGSHVVVAANSGFSFSDNFGATWTSGGGTPCTFAVCDGDPSLAVGQTGAMYYAWIGGATGLTNDGLSRSTNNGHTFPFQASMVACPGVSSCSVPDQEHIAADRINAGASGDRLYNVWRNFPTGAAAFSIRIVCSSNSGAAWGAQQVIGAGDLPRVSVGGDGFVYAAWASGGSMMLNKYSNCDAGLAVQPGFPITVAAFTNVVCPVAGLDRCNGFNILSSPTVAADDLDANHIYYAFATSTAVGNEDVMVFDSTNGGLNFTRNVRVNAAVAGRRFMPWLSTYGGVAVVSWYDRRNAVAATNDRTRYFIGSAAVKGANLVAGTETDLSGTDDAQCALWPCPTGAISDSEGCFAQPQIAGRCAAPAPAPVPAGAPDCDFSSTACGAGLVCRPNRGCPKYGDYNGTAASAGRHYSAWASATAPVGVVGAPAGINVYTSTDFIPSDFFVRDWTNSTTDHDGGMQPSTNPTFWATSDVWNQNTITAAAFPLPADWILGDPPSRVGSNFVFARVSRRAAAGSTASPTLVSVNLLQADFGLGSMFTSAGTETVTFGPGDLTKVTPGHSWTVSATASIHLCLAAQITAPDDNFAPPSLITTAPGPADPLIIADNNKAQRNLQETIGTGGTSGSAEMFAMIRNALDRARPMEIGIHWPGARVPARVSIVGGRSIDLGDEREPRINLGEMKPGEIRWLKFRVVPSLDKPVTVDFFDAAGGDERPSNGFSIQFARAPLEVVAGRNMMALADVLTRIAILEKSDEASREAEAARRAAPSGRISRGAYLSYLKTHRAAIAQVVNAHRRKSKNGDPFEAGSAMKDLTTGLKAGNAEAVAAAQNALTERLDAELTSMVRAG